MPPDKRGSGPAKSPREIAAIDAASVAPAADIITTARRRWAYRLIGRVPTPPPSKGSGRVVGAGRELAREGRRGRRRRRGMGDERRSPQRRSSS